VIRCCSWSGTVKLRPVRNVGGRKFSWFRTYRKEDCLKPWSKPWPQAVKCLGSKVFMVGSGKCYGVGRFWRLIVVLWPFTSLTENSVLVSWRRIVWINSWVNYMPGWVLHSEVEDWVALKVKHMDLVFLDKDAALFGLEMVIGLGGNYRRKLVWKLADSPVWPILSVWIFVCVVNARPLPAWWESVRNFYSPEILRGEGFCSIFAAWVQIWTQSSIQP